MPEEDHPDDADGGNIQAMCMNCQTRYTTGEGSFQKRSCACPRCGSSKAMHLGAAVEGEGEG